MLAQLCCRVSFPTEYHVRAETSSVLPVSRRFLIRKSHKDTNLAAHPRPGGTGGGWIRTNEYWCCAPAPWTTWLRRRLKTDTSTVTSSFHYATCSYILQPLSAHLHQIISPPASAALYISALGLIVGLLPGGGPFVDPPHTDEIYLAKRRRMDYHH